MTNLHGRKILLGITGSIAAYKAAILARLLMKLGAEVRVVMTKDAQSFISPLTLQTLTRNPVGSAISEESDWNNHVELGIWADLMLIAPATANTIAKLANGICDNLLTAVYLSARCPVMIAPAMDLDMWKHPSTVRNLNTLKLDEVITIPVSFGELASGLEGEGRLAEPEEIVNHVINFFSSEKPLSGKKIVITAGPTLERLDPVRYIGNMSSGKMGVALAESALSLGAEVVLIYGPGTAVPPESATIIHVQSARDMYNALQKSYEGADVVIFSAAVADYRPEKYMDEKIKKDHDNNLALRLIRNPDIALEFGKLKKPGVIHAGFALETHNPEAYAKDKLIGKNFDLIALNLAGSETYGMNSEFNKVKLFFSDGREEEIALMTKKEVAKHMMNAILALMNRD
jgi:phosphopantothenoylcysteine decarboxylase / phosphopantothenate---cysteine ligase